jgi:hypothetical protein
MSAPEQSTCRDLLMPWAKATNPCVQNSRALLGGDSASRHRNAGRSSGFRRARCDASSRFLSCRYVRQHFSWKLGTHNLDAGENRAP